MRKILIVINGIELKATLFDTQTADAIYTAIPFKGYAQLWGDEIYFGIPIKMGQEAEAREEVEVGDLAFWPVGSAFCIFFGRTPVSINNKPRAYSPVNVFGKIEGNPEVLKQVNSQSLIQVKKLQTE
jgi:hypothetical protein